MPLAPFRCVLLLCFVTACSGSNPPDSDAGVPHPEDAGSDAGATTDAGNTPDGGALPEEAYCENLCAHQTGCRPQDTHDACDAPACTARAALYREGVRVALEECLTVDCSVNEDACFTQAAQSAGTRPVDESFRTECTARHAACSNAFPAGICTTTNGTELYLESAVEDAKACLSEACADVLDCFVTALGGPK